MTKPDDPQGPEVELSDRQMWRVTIAAPIQTVWNTLIRTDEVQPFLFGAVCESEGELAEGKPMRMISRNGKIAVAVGRVLVFDPPYRFSHTISFTQVQNERPARTTYELKEVPEGTEVTLLSEAVPGSEMGKMAKTGTFIVDNLKRYIETGKPKISGRMVMAMAPLMNMMAPARSRQEHWPLSSIS